MERADALIVASINDLTERHGFGLMAVPRPPLFQLFSLQDDPDGLWVVEDADRILGFAFSWVCGELWFLAQLFVSPGHQGHGIGDMLLKRTLEHAQKTGVTNRALITFAFNRASQGLYIRHGLLPRLPLYFVAAPREALTSRLHGARYRCVPLENSVAHLRSLAEIDAQALGVSREKHHKFLIADGTIKGVALYAGDDCVGYAYVATDGQIGPLAVKQPGEIGAAFVTALSLAAGSGAPQVSAFLAGTSDALRIAVEHGMRITIPMMLMSTREFGNWTRYLPRNPGFM